MATIAAAASIDEKQPACGWAAQLRLRFAERSGRTYVAERSHSGPLLIQRPFYPEGGVCHVCVVHPPGGVVGGDRLRIDVAAGPNADVLVTTPAAAKFYRSNGELAHQSQELAAEGAALEWLPQESIFYPGAQVRAATRVRLAPRSRFIGWEIACLGLPARQEPFDVGELHLDLELWAQESPVFIDRLRLSGANKARSASWGLASSEAVGTLLAFPANRTMLVAVRDVIEQEPGAAVTLVDEVLVCRCLASQGEEIKKIFTRVWQTARPLLLGRPAVPPRIWAT
jgi:urease accessory protein